MSTAKCFDVEGPVRRGEIYCSRWCGNKCTHAAFVKATAEAVALATLLGPGWKPDVWENMGWHYCVISPCGRLKIHPPRRGLGGYDAFLSPDPKSAGGIFVESARTPRAAIAKVRAHAARYLANAIAMLEACG